MSQNPSNYNPKQDPIVLYFTEEFITKLLKEEVNRNANRGD